MTLRAESGVRWGRHLKDLLEEEGLELSLGTWGGAVARGGAEKGTPGRRSSLWGGGPSAAWWQLSQRRAARPGPHFRPGWGC